MSRIGKKVIVVPKDVVVSVADAQISVSGKKGMLEFSCPREISVSFDRDKSLVSVLRGSEDKQSRSLHGLTRALINNMVLGVSKGFERKLEVIGTGYNAKLGKNEIVLQIGFCHSVNVPIPAGLEVKIPNPTRIEISGADKQLVGQFAADIRRVRPPEVYKGKGIKYENEVIRKKAGKAAGDKK